MKVQRNRDGKTVDVSRSEGEWLIGHGYATAVEDEAPAKPKRAPRKPKVTTQSEITEGDEASSSSDPSHSE